MRPDRATATSTATKTATGPGRGRRLPLRKSLLGRLLAVSALVAVCSVAATAWLAAQTTSGAIKREQGRNLTNDAMIYRTLLGHAATNAQWDGVQSRVTELAERYDRRIALTTRSRVPIADSATEDAPPALPENASAVIDPLNTEAVLDPTAEQEAEQASLRVGKAGSGAGALTPGGIDARAVGPFRLSAEERTRLGALADTAVSCLRGRSITAEPVVTPSGRTWVRATGYETGDLGDLRERCGLTRLEAPTDTESAALKALTKLSDDCLSRKGRKGVPLRMEFGSGPDMKIAVQGRTPREEVLLVAPVDPKAAQVVPQPAESKKTDEKGVYERKVQGVVRLDSVVENCVDTARRDQLGSFVSSPALLFISDPDGAEVPGFDLSRENTARIAGAAALVLALTVGASVLAATRLVRPLRALTSAAQRMKDGGDAEPVPVRGDNEMGRLAAAFNDMAEHRARLEHQRREMVGDVAHELRTPLSTIRGWLEGAQDGVADLDPAFVSSLLEEAVQLQHIIDDLQDLAQADAGELRLSPVPVRIDELLPQVASAHAPRAEAAGVTLTVSEAVSEAEAGVVEKAGELAADPVRLRQAVDNLVSNAVRHTPRGGTVTLRAYEEGEGAGRRVAIEVSDTGSGIAADDLPYVFDRFWRADKSRNRRTGGSGLGLAIVRKLAEAHGGSATAASRVGQGSVFTLWIPALPRADGEDIGT
ncbi:HAMP domain-containing sensor histidine kinase [Streptomyces sp. NPDC048057]|uniref:sensor histidine kinase n=1 Tax=Streptomyces sp. NPDC048057 TaxID=3155628 RepID=UPI0033C3B7A9